MGRRLPFAVLCVALAVLAACSDDKVDPSKPENQKVLEVGLDEDGHGTCLLVEEDFPPEVKKLPVIGCDQPHSHEVYAKIAYFTGAGETTSTVDVFPGLAALNDFADTQCLAAFTTYVGISRFDSRLTDTWLLPTLDGWNKDHDRSVLCLVLDPANEKVVGSFKDSNQ